LGQVLLKAHKSALPESIMRGRAVFPILTRILYALYEKKCFSEWKREVPLEKTDRSS
jgi:hypothetical protein